MLLVIEPNPLIARIVAEAAQAICSVRIVEAESWESARTILQTRSQFCWIVLEANLDGCLLSGVIRQLRTEQPQARLAVIGSRVDDLREDLLAMGTSLVLPTELLVEDSYGILADFLTLPPS